MAEEEEYEFTPPDFDEDAFIHKEMVSFRATLVLFMWGIVLSLVTWGIFIAMEGDKSGWLLSLGIAAVGGYALKFIFPAVGIDISHYKRREWLGTGFLFFFTWLAFAILLVNPPISDFTDPSADIYISPDHQMAGGDVTLDFFFGDNAKLTGSEFTVSRGGTALATLEDAERIGSGHYRFTATGWEAGTYSITATATDGKKHTTTTEATFQIRGPSNPNAIKATIPDVMDTGDFAIVTIPADVEPYAVYAQIEGRNARVYFEEDATIGGWKASNIFAGWVNGANNFTIVVEEFNAFQGLTLIPGGKVVLGPFGTDVVGASGAYDDSIPKAQSVIPPNRQVPGLGIGVLAIGLVGVALVVRSRK